MSAGTYLSRLLNAPGTWIYPANLEAFPHGPIFGSPDNVAMLGAILADGPDVCHLRRQSDNAFERGEIHKWNPHAVVGWVHIHREVPLRDCGTTKFRTVVRFVRLRKNGIMHNRGVDCATRHRRSNRNDTRINPVNDRPEEDPQLARDATDCLVIRRCARAE